MKIKKNYMKKIEDILYWKEKKYSRFNSKESVYYKKI